MNGEHSEVSSSRFRTVVFVSYLIFRDPIFENELWKNMYTLVPSSIFYFIFYSVCLLKVCLNKWQLVRWICWKYVIQVHHLVLYITCYSTSCSDGNFSSILCTFRVEGTMGHYNMGPTTYTRYAPKSLERVHSCFKFHLASVVKSIGRRQYKQQWSS